MKTIKARKPMLGIPLNLFENSPSENHQKKGQEKTIEKRLSENHGGQKGDDWRPRKSL